MQKNAPIYTTTPHFKSTRIRLCRGVPDFSDERFISNFFVASPDRYARFPLRDCPKDGEETEEIIVIVYEMGSDADSYAINTVPVPGCHNDGSSFGVQAGRMIKTNSL